MLFIILDSLIATGSMLAIGWALLLGSLATASNEDMLAKFLGLYYPTSDIALLSFVFFLLLRAQGAYDYVRARRYGLLILGLGLTVFATSDFLFNVQQNMGTYADVSDTWVDIGWPLGLLIVSAAASLRRFFPLSREEEQAKRIASPTLTQNRLGLRNLAIYALVAVLFFVLCMNIFSTNSGQISATSSAGALSFDHCRVGGCTPDTYYYRKQSPRRSSILCIGATGTGKSTYGGTGTYDRAKKCRS